MAVNVLVKERLGRLILGRLMLGIEMLGGVTLERGSVKVIEPVGAL